MTASAEPETFTSQTPSGIEVQYEPRPKRLYRVKGREDWQGWVEAPSVTTILGCLNTPLDWWGQEVGVSGVLTLLERGVLQIWASYDEDSGEMGQEFCDAAGGIVDAEDIIRFLKQEKLTVSYVRDKAGDRGTSIHDALEYWAAHGDKPDIGMYPAEEQGYAAGLLSFLDDLGPVEVEGVEVMVGSVDHNYAGRYDLRVVIPHTVALVVNAKTGAEEEFEGRGMLDLKTSKDVYGTHFMQLSAYELASRECGYGHTDWQAVVRVTQDGMYEVRRLRRTVFEDFLRVRWVYDSVRNAEQDTRRRQK